MTTPRITEAERAALPVARAAVEGRASAYGPADSIVFALGSAHLLNSPAAAAELATLQERVPLLEARLAELEPFEALHPQQCERQQHRSWFSAADGPVPCPWCRIAELEGELDHIRTFRADTATGPPLAAPVAGRQGQDPRTHRRTQTTYGES